VVELYAFLG